MLRVIKEDVEEDLWGDSGNDGNQSQPPHLERNHFICIYISIEVWSEGIRGCTISHDLQNK